MKKYIYFSNTKVETLFSKFEKSIDKKSDNSINIDFKMFSDSLKNNKGHIQKSFNETEDVLNRLSECNLVGSLTDNKEYISDFLEMKWGYYFEGKNQIIYCGYKSENLLLGLAGSSHNLILEQGNGNGLAFSHSYTLAMANWFFKNIEDGLPTPTKASYLHFLNFENMKEGDIANATYLATDQMDGKLIRFQFLAKVLHRSHWDFGFRSSEYKDIVLATPLYISIDT